MSKFINRYPGRKWVKEGLAKVIFFVLGRAFQSASKLDHGLQREIAEWKEGLKIKLKILPDGPEMLLKKEQGRVKYLKKVYQPADLQINFKNIECAFLILTPQVGLAQVFAEHRMNVVGDLNLTMSFNRCMSIMLSYLYPDFICKRLLKRIPNSDPEKNLNRLHIYVLGILFGK